MAPTLLVETRADGDEEETEPEDLSGKVKSSLNYYHLASLRTCMIVYI